MFKPSTQCVREQFFSKRRDKELRTVQKRLPKSRHTLKGASVWKPSGCVDGRISFGGPPTANRVEILNRQSDRVHY